MMFSTTQSKIQVLSCLLSRSVTIEVYNTVIIPKVLYGCETWSLTLREEHIKKLHGLSPRANYTVRATADCRRSDCQHFADIGCHVVSVTDPYGRILSFLDRSRYFSVK
jgi:hypothetical protein